MRLFIQLFPKYNAYFILNEWENDAKKISNWIFLWGKLIQSSTFRIGEKKGKAVQDL